MAVNDTCVSIVPYFKVHQGQLDNFKAGCEKFIEKTQPEEKCLYYGFCFNGDEVHCREGYADAERIGSEQCGAAHGCILGTGNE